MSLVAYGSSDESEDEYQEDCTPNVGVLKTEEKRTKVLNSENSSLSLQSSESCIESNSSNNIQSENQDSVVNSDVKSTLFLSIPPPKTQSVTVSDLKSDELPGKKTTVKITVPSLSEFKDEELEPSKKKLKPSAKGSGLFALLPAPKNVFMKETKSADGSKTQAPLVPRSISKPPPMIPKKYLKPTEEDIVVDNQESLDFFSLGSLNDVPDEVSGEELSGPYESSLNLPPPRSWSMPDSSSASVTTIEGQSSTDTQGEDDFIPVDNGNIQLSEEALQALCGRRATRHQQTQEVEVIDVSGAELLPDPKEWLTKQLTEERRVPARGFGRRHDGPTSQQRRKHQITYLAFQAKENELELKNQWSQNRMSRKQTQSKYGF